MARVTILGAGDMGTALVTPLSRNRNDVRLWGTDRDDAIVAALRAGAPHPRLGARLPENVTVYDTGQAPEALAGADVVVVAITSDAVRSVVGSLQPLLSEPAAVVTVAKGFDRGSGDRIQLLPETIAGFTPAPVIAVGGPAKANEVAHGQPTAVVFGSGNREALARCRGLFGTEVYRVVETDDVAGLEIAAAMKNAYAIALGIPDGLEQQTGKPHHNLRAALFSQAVSEMSLLAEAVGGRGETVRGLAGTGDLQVTITSGRNRLLGEMIGLGEQPTAAMNTLTAQGTTIEGYLAADFGYRLYLEVVASGSLAGGSLPLLDALWRILYDRAPTTETLWDAVP